MPYDNIREEELKNKIAQDYFSGFDCTKIIGNVDFCVIPKLGNNLDPLFETQSLLWAEAKKGKSDIINSIVQLILTISKARTFDKQLPPAFLGAFDSFQMAFLPYNDIHEIFYQNDFNWNVTASNYETREFKQLRQSVQQIIQTKSLLFEYDTDHTEIQEFIQTNFVATNSNLSKIQIDKNNFFVIYNKWLKAVKPTISFPWDKAKTVNIIDADFYLADLMSQENQTFKDNLFVQLRVDKYELDRKLDDIGMFSSKRAIFMDNQKAHQQFWNKYERPPRQEYRDYIVERRDLLVPQDVRERKGSFFTPQIWVELSQKYLTDVLGQNWQDEYYIWDCAAGTGNLLAGLTNKYNIYASTLDTQDVDVMRDRIGNGANLLADHVFQFDFLNDEFDNAKVPASLQKILNDPEKRKKLVIYINPPYAEHGSRSTISSHGEHKANVATETKVYTQFSQTIGTGARELFTQFFLRLYKDIPNCKLASFSTLKFVNSQNFLKFRNYFKAEYKKGFICKADSFDNVKGQFPIGFTIWDLTGKQNISVVKTDIILTDINQTLFWEEGIKTFNSFGSKDFISSWLRKFYSKEQNELGYLILPGVDMQQQNGVYITVKPTESDIIQHKTARITKSNLVQMSIYLSIRQCIESTWINNRDQFLFPNDDWKTDSEFQNDCLAFALFHGQNKITGKDGTNNWIPFTETEVNARTKFESSFMTDYIAGKIKDEETGDHLFSDPGEVASSKEAPRSSELTLALEFSPEAKFGFCRWPGTLAILSQPA